MEENLNMDPSAVSKFLLRISDFKRSSSPMQLDGILGGYRD